MKKIFLLLFVLLLLVNYSCKKSNDNDDNNKENVHVCSEFKEETSANVEELKCGEEYEIYKICLECGKKTVISKETKPHRLITVTKAPTCGKEGYEKRYCLDCGHVVYNHIIEKTNDHDLVEEEPTGLENLKCGEKYNIYNVCSKCGEKFVLRTETVPHELVVERIEPSCGKDGYISKHCLHCDYIEEYEVLPKIGEHNFVYGVIEEPKGINYGLVGEKCSNCGEIKSSTKIYQNGHYLHGKLSVKRADLVDKNGDKFQLVGLSTHGLQWFSKYVNLNTFEGIHNEFLNNVFRLSLYTSENGYCECSETKKEQLYNTVVAGIEAATKLDCYVIVDWHMLGAENVNDKNPLYYMEEAKVFFDKISKQFKDYDNVLYEIMNEPSGSTTWADCKKYAETIIPIIRKNSDGIILVGNPKWSADLDSVMNDPLVGYSNIMYTFHFYANDSYNQKRLTNAYDKGFPVFVTEHGGMEASGDGAIDYDSVKKWYTEMDKRNISYVAWNISNSKGSASIIKYGDSTMTNFSDAHLKEWGIYYKTVTRSRIENLSN